MMFCIKCGKTAVRDNFCRECFLERNELFSIENITLKKCSVCGSLYDNAWIKGDDALEKIIHNNIKTKNKINKIKISTKQIGNKIHAEITATGNIKNVAKTDKKKIMIILRNQMCDMCVKKSGGYYDAFLQIRGHNADQIFDIIRALPGFEDMAVSTERLKEGYDIKIMHKGFANRATRVAKEEGFEVETSYRLAAEKKGKKLYRNYYAIR